MLNLKVNHKNKMMNGLSNQHSKFKIQNIKK